MEVYLDNSATTRARDGVIEKINYMLKCAYGNPSSLHRMGLEAEKEIKVAREVVAGFLGVRNEEVYFTSSGTESNNIAIQGIVNKYSKKGKHLITSKIEHSSVLNTFKHYEQMGYRVTYLDVDDKGLVNLQQLEDSIGEDSILVSIMLVNNEIGTIQPIRSIKKIISQRNGDIKLHVDAIQAFGKIDIDVSNLGIDTLSFSGHKIHGPKGIGGLYIRKNLNLAPIIFGGNQEQGLRSGTENVPGIVGLGEAVRILTVKFREESMHISRLKEHFIDELNKRISDIKVNSFIDERSSPHILNISFNGVRGEVLLHYLEDEGIYVSTGSACSSHNRGKSKVLSAIGLKDKEIEGAVRFSFAFSNTFDEINYVVDKLENAVAEIRKIIMR